MKLGLGVLAVVVISGTPSGGPAVPPPRLPAHDLHVSHTRLVFDGRTVACRIRLFHDDLQLALRAASGKPQLRLTPTDRADSLFAGYFRSHVRLEGDGSPVLMHVTASGMEPDAAAQQVVWYVMEGTVSEPVVQVRLLNGLLFESFADQQNIVQLLSLPGETRQTFYFTASDPREQKLELSR
jgi:hypothetical protein